MIQSALATDIKDRLLEENRAYVEAILEGETFGINALAEFLVACDNQRVRDFNILIFARRLSPHGKQLLLDVAKTLKLMSELEA